MTWITADGLGSTRDPAFQQSFADLYSAPSLQVPWYNVLGNHDYGDGAPREDALPGHCGPTNQGCYFSPVHQVRCIDSKHNSGLVVLTSARDRESKLDLWSAIRCQNVSAKNVSHLKPLPPYSPDINNLAEFVEHIF